MFFCLVFCCIMNICGLVASLLNMFCCGKEIVIGLFAWGDVVQAIYTHSPTPAS
jgi:hypothetical protein